MTECDYAEALRAEFDIEIQSEAFGFNITFTIEVITYEYRIKNCNDVRNQVKSNIDFYSHFHITLLRI